MLVRKDKIKTLDEYIEDLESMKGTLTDLQDAELDALIEYVKGVKNRDHEYVWVNSYDLW